jgi:uncharacterized protein
MKNRPVMMTQPLVFGSAERRLFGSLHPAAVPSPGRPAVVLCNAFGQEATRAHRFMRVLAERLSRNGHTVLRFDFFGTGDAMGDDQDGDLAGWADDVHTADLALRERSGAQQVVWIGMRLGGSIALQAAQRAPVGLGRLVLWDPVLDGSRYLQHLRNQHVASLEAAFSLPSRPAPAELARDPNCFRDEAIGFAVSPLLRRQLEAIRLSEHRWPAHPASIVVLTDPDDRDGKDLAAVCMHEPGRAQRVPLRHGTDWTSDTANDSALVPAAALAELLRYAGAPL